MKDLVSICVPTYNGANYISESIESILNQTYKDLDILVIDDQSNDDTVEIIRSYMSRDKRIRLIQNSHNLGLVKNWNKCIKEAKGQWIKFHFQDDSMLPNTVEKMMEMCSENDLRIVLTDRTYLFEDEMNRAYLDSLSKLSGYFKKNTIISPVETFELFRNESIEHNFIGEPIVGMFHTSLIGKFGDFDVELSQIVDFEFWFRIMCNEKTGFIAEKLHQFRIHTQSQGAKNMKVEGMTVLDLDKINLAFKITTNKHYSKLRIDIGFSEIKEMFYPIINTILLNYGWLGVKKKGVSEKVKFFAPSNRIRYKALKKDFKQFWKRLGGY